MKIEIPKVKPIITVDYKIDVQDFYFRLLNKWEMFHQDQQFPLIVTASQDLAAGVKTKMQILFDTNKATLVGDQNIIENNKCNFIIAEYPII